ncbi:hypothetical protein Tco_1440470 [Tanacetum coccineum]
MVKNQKLNVKSTSPVLSARSYLTKDPQFLTRIHSSINAITICPKQTNKSCDDKSDEGEEEKDNPKNINTTPPSPFDPSISFIIENVRKLNSFLESSGLKYDDSYEEELEVEVNGMTEGLGVEYFATFPTRRRKLEPMEDPNRGVSNFTGRIKGMHVFVGNFTYGVDFMIVEDISSIIDPRLSHVVLGKPFIKISNMTHELSLGVVKFTNRINEIAYKIPHKIEQYDSLSDLEKELTKSVYLRNKEDKRRGVECVMNKILGFYKECLELGPKYLTGVADEEGVTLYLMRTSLKVLRKFPDDDSWRTI